MYTSSTRVGGPGGVLGGNTNPNGAPPPRVHDVQGPPDDCISRLRWSPASCPVQLLGSTSWDKTVRVWQIVGEGDNIQSQPMAMTQDTMPVLDMSFSSDGRAFFGGCSKSASEWNLTTNQTRQVAAHDLPISCLEYSNASAQEMLITCGWDGKIRFWDLRQQAPVREENVGAPVVCMDARTAPMATFCTGRKIVVFDMNSMTKFAEVEPHSMVKYSLRCIANFRNQTGFLIGSSEGRVAAVPLNAQQTPQLSCCFKAHCLENMPSKGQFTMFPTNFVSVHPETNTGVSGGGDGSVRFWSMTTKARSYELPPRLHNGQAVPVSAGAFNSTGSLVSFAVSYDWSMGKDGVDPTQPRAICVMGVNPAWLK